MADNNAKTSDEATGVGDETLVGKVQSVDKQRARKIARVVKSQLGSIAQDPEVFAGGKWGKFGNDHWLNLD